MPKKDLVIIAWDTETTGTKPGHHEVIEIGAVAYDFQSLERIPGSEFRSMMRCMHPDRVEPKALECNGFTMEEITDPKVPTPDVLWPRFYEYVKSYNRSKTKGAWSAPIPCGKNVKDFDLKFAFHLNKKYLKNGSSTVMFNKKTIFDVEDELMRWFAHDEDIIDLKMDTIRQYMGLSAEGAHTALVDAEQSALIMMKFLKMYRSLKALTKNGKPFIGFKNCFANT
jgi:DNA polymerase III epsilon subunit-like protein